MADVVPFIIFFIGPGIYLLFHGRSLLKRGRGGKLTRNGRIEISGGIVLLLFGLLPILAYIYIQFWMLYDLNDIPFLLLVYGSPILLLWIIFKRINLTDILAGLKNALGMSSGKEKTNRSKKSKDNVIIPLHKILDQSFNDEELRTLCAYLGVDYDNLPGRGKSAKARELILHLKRRNKIHQLIEIGVDLRPQIEWRNAFRQGNGKYDQN